MKTNNLSKLFDSYELKNGNPRNSWCMYFLKWTVLYQNLVHKLNDSAGSFLWNMLKLTKLWYCLYISISSQKSVIYFCVSNTWWWICSEKPCLLLWTRLPFICTLGIIKPALMHEWQSRVKTHAPSFNSIKVKLSILEINPRKFKKIKIKLIQLYH